MPFDHWQQMLPRRGVVTTTKRKRGLQDVLPGTHTVENLHAIFMRHHSLKMLVFQHVLGCACLELVKLAAVYTLLQRIHGWSTEAWPMSAW